MRRALVVLALTPAVALVLGPAPAVAGSCRGNTPEDIMVRVGPLCVDKYEASVWSNRNGTGTQYPQDAPRYPETFPGNGNWTVPLYALSKRGVSPARFLTWFQAQQACALSGKRLLTNAEWQMAAAGTPDPGADGDGTTTCNTNTVGPLPTGSSPNCRSRWGVADMVGNVQEWVADWTHGAGFSPGGAALNEWRPGRSVTSIDKYGEDSLYGFNEAFHQEAPQMGGDGDDFRLDSLPAAIKRGGLWSGGAGAGVFTMFAAHTPSSLDNGTGFRCAR